MNAKIAGAAALALMIAVAVLSIAGSSDEVPPREPQKPLSVDEVKPLVELPLALVSLLDERVNDVPISAATSRDVSAAIERAGCKEVTRETERPIFVTQVSCDGRPSTVTFVAEGSLPPATLDGLMRKGELGAVVRVGGALLAVRGDETLLGKLTRRSRTE